MRTHPSTIAHDCPIPTAHPSLPLLPLIHPLLQRAPIPCCSLHPSPAAAPIPFRCPVLLREVVGCRHPRHVLQARLHRPVSGRPHRFAIALYCSLLHAIARPVSGLSASLHVRPCVCPIHTRRVPRAAGTPATRAITSSTSATCCRHACPVHTRTEAYATTPTLSRAIALYCTLLHAIARDTRLQATARCCTLL